MKVLSSFTRKFPLLFGLAALIVIFCISRFMPSLALGQWSITLNEVILALLAIVVALLFISPSPFVFSAKGAKYAFKKSLYYLIITFLMGIISLIGGLAQLFMQEQSAATILSGLLSAIIFCIAIGIFEELLFRVFLFGGLLAKWGSSTKGIILAAVISSLVFGFAHVFPSLLSGNALGFAEIVCLITKTLQAGILGLLCCALYLKTKNVMILIVLHALNDFMLMVGAFLNGNTVTATYVYGVSGEQMIMSIILLLVSIPVIIIAIKMLKQVKTPEKGPMLSDNFKPCIPE